MSFVDLATLAIHRRNELEARINVFSNKCDHAVNGIKKLKLLGHGFIENLNCEPGELKERFLKCMKQLDEFTYIVTDFNLAINKLEANNNVELAPVHDSSIRELSTPSSCTPFNIMDALTEPTASTSKTCSNQCPSEKPTHNKVPKEDQLLIAFSSASCSSESVPQTKNDNTSKKEAQCKILGDTKNMLIKCENKETIQQNVFENFNLPAQSILQTDQEYPATILNVDGTSFWVTTENLQEVHGFIDEMTEYYQNDFVDLTLDDVMSLTYCASYDNHSNCFYRCLFIRLLDETKDNMNMVEVFLVDTGDVQITPIVNIQPLAARFCSKPPYVRCCHLAGIDLYNNNKDLPERLEKFLKRFIGMPCVIKVDENTSESLGVFVRLNGPNNHEVLNTLLVEQGLARAIESVNLMDERTVKGPPGIVKSELDITDCPEHDDPVEAVTGYHNRDEADICKHYKGGPAKTCFKGARCTKKHVLKHPDGWTLDRVPVAGKCRPLPLPAPGTWLRVRVTHVAHYNCLYIQLLNPQREESVPSYGVVMPPTNLDSLERDMNSPAAWMAYKPLKMSPAPGELVAALYPIDDHWYRAKVLSSTRADQCVEVMYIDYGNVMWVKEDGVKELEPRFWTLESQAIRCSLVGVRARSSCSKEWAAAKTQLQKLVHERTLSACVIARNYDEIAVELYDEKGVNIAEQMAASEFIELTEYTLEDDRAVKQKIVAA